MTPCSVKFFDDRKRETAWFRLTRDRSVWTNYQVPILIDVLAALQLMDVVVAFKTHIIFHMDVLVSYLAQISALMKRIHRDLDDFPVLKPWVALLVPWGRRRRQRICSYGPHH